MRVKERRMKQAEMSEGKEGDGDGSCTSKQ
jgi:hypothetical protein